MQQSFNGFGRRCVFLSRFNSKCKLSIKWRVRKIASDNQKRNIRTICGCEDEMKKKKKNGNQLWMKKAEAIIYSYFARLDDFYSYMKYVF